MELGRLRAIAVQKDHPSRRELNASEQGRETADEHQPETRFAIGALRARRRPQQRNEAVVISCLHVTVQKDGRGLPRGQGGFDHRFEYARWDGSAWRVHEIAYAGRRLYAGEDDYTGLAALDPKNPNVVYISTDADPVTGAPLVSRADGQRHRELYRGTTGDFGATWQWEPITANSDADNLRPIVPKWTDPRTALVWMRGTYKNNHGEWTTKVVASILP